MKRTFTLKKVEPWRAVGRRQSLIQELTGALLWPVWGGQTVGGWTAEAWGDQSAELQDSDGRD